MHYHYHGYPNVKLLVLCLVAPHLEAEPGSDTSADEGEEEKRGFGNAPTGFLGFAFVNAVGDEGDEVEG